MMKEQELNNLLDKAIGTKGNLQIHSYWMNKTLKGIIEYNKTLINDNIKLIKDRIPSIPTEISYFSNDVGYVTEDYLYEQVDHALSVSSDNPISNYVISRKIYSISDSLNHLLSISDSKYEFVDLGLPSGLKWATCNIGATKPEECGLYFAWGETEGYTGITDTKKFKWSDYELCNGSNNTLTKYNANSSYGIVDNLTTLEQVDDAAYQSDNICRMPTIDNFYELVDNTTQSYEFINKTCVIRFTSRKNCNYIFIPCGGRLEDGDANDSKQLAQLWTSKGNNHLAYACSLRHPGDGGWGDVTGLNRYLGLNVRAVLEADKGEIFKPKECLKRIKKLENQLPTKVSQLENDSNYINKTELESKLAEIENQLVNVYTKSEIDNMIISTLNTEV